jgi:hypothetical protein
MYELNVKPENNNIKEGDNIEIFYNNVIQGRYIVANIIHNDNSS